MFTVLSPSPATAAPAVTDGGVQNNFPQGMLFSVSAESPAPITEIRLRYKVLPDGTAAIGRPEFTPGTSVTTTFELEGNNPPKIYLAPGTIIEYYWEVTDETGAKSTTETQSFFYDDVRFDWAPAEGNGVTIYYYSGSQSDAEDMLATATETISEMSALLGATIDFPVKVWIYDSVDDMRPALRRESETYEQSIITAGVRVASDTVLVLGNVSFDTLRHELTHVVTKQAGESAFGTLPSWLDEGTAVYGQTDTGAFRAALQDALNRGEVLSVRSISSYPANPDNVGLFYGESWSLVSYLIDTYGVERFAQLYAEIKGGKRIGPALEAVYGFDQDGLDNEWRAAHGLPPRETPEPTEPASDATDSPSDPQDEPQQDGGGGGTSAVLIIALAVGLAVLAGAVGVAGWTVARRL